MYDSRVIVHTHPGYFARRNSLEEVSLVDMRLAETVRSLKYYENNCANRR